MKALRRKLTYANVTATLALVFAMSGGALAAKHYLLNSTSQVNPRVLHALETTDRKIFVQLSRSVTVAGAINAGTATNAARRGPNPRRDLRAGRRSWTTVLDDRRRVLG